MEKPKKQKKVFSIKMRFQITTEDGKITEYDSFSQCGKEMGLKSRTLYRFLHNEAGGGKFTRRSDGKVFWIEGIGKDKLIPLMKIDGEDFFFLFQAFLKDLVWEKQNFLINSRKILLDLLMLQANRIKLILCLK